MKTYVNLVFDDGFVASCLQIADIYEARGLSATFAVLVNHEDFMVKFPKGDFTLWNALQNRGHIIHLHGFDHTDLSKIPFDEAKDKIEACLAYFTEHLKDFDASNSMYHLTYNRSTPEIDDFLLTKVKAIRSTGLEGLIGTGMNNDKELKRRILTCAWFGPENGDAHLMATLKKAEIEQPKLLLYMLHGLGKEGWGPINAKTLEQALDYVSASPMLCLTNLSEKALSDILY